MLLIFPDVEFWATQKIRTGLIAEGRSERVSTSYRGGSEVVVRRDGGPQLDQVREAPRLGVNVYRVGDDTDDEVNELAALVSAILRGSADGTVPRVRQSSGPSPIPEQDKRRRYMTFDLVTRA